MTKHDLISLTLTVLISGTVGAMVGALIGVVQDYRRRQERSKQRMWHVLNND